MRDICEVGFNAGHSAAAFLAANRDARVTSFDLAAHGHTEAAAAVRRDTPRASRAPIDSTTVL